MYIHIHIHMYMHESAKEACARTQTQTRILVYLQYEHALECPTSASAILRCFAQGSQSASRRVSAARLPGGTVSGQARADFSYRSARQELRRFVACIAHLNSVANVRRKASGTEQGSAKPAEHVHCSTGKGRPKHGCPLGCHADVRSSEVFVKGRLTYVVLRLSKCDAAEKGRSNIRTLCWLCSFCQKKTGGQNSEKLAAARSLTKDVLDSFTAMREYLREVGAERPPKNGVLIHMFGRSGDVLKELIRTSAAQLEKALVASGTSCCWECQVTMRDWWRDLWTGRKAGRLPSA